MWPHQSSNQKFSLTIIILISLGLLISIGGALLWIAPSKHPQTKSKTTSSIANQSSGEDHYSPAGSEALVTTTPAAVVAEYITALTTLDTNLTASHASMNENLTQAETALLNVHVPKELLQKHLTAVVSLGRFNDTPPTQITEITAVVDSLLAQARAL